MAKVSPDGNDDTLAELENGPVQNRECRDILCCLLFIAAFGAMIVLASIAAVEGNPYKIMAPFDSSDNQCGVSSGFTSFKKLFFVSPLYSDEPSFARSLCLSKCPTDYQATVDCKINSVVTSCTGTKTNQADILASFAAGSSDTVQRIMIYPTKDVLNVLCAPQLDALKAVMTGITIVQDALGTAQKYVSEILQNASILGIALGIALVLGLFFMVFLQYCAGVFVWTMIIVFHLIIAALAYLFYNKAQIDETQKQQNQTICYIFLGILGTFFIFFLCMYKRIKLAIGIIKTAALFTKEVKSALIIPFFQFTVFGILFTLWIIGFLYVYTIGVFTKMSTKMPFPQANHNNIQQGYQLYWIFMGLWINALIGAIGTFVVASSACIWYFAQLNAHKPVSRSFYRAFRYHLGSLAFGSLILAIVQLIRIILTYLQKKAKDSGADKNPLFKIIMCCLQCYMACLERFIAFLNKNAYIQIALNGKSFCSAAKDALFLLMKNPARSSAVSGLGSIFVIIGEMFVAAGTLIACYFIVNNIDPWKTSVTEPYIIYLLCLVIGYSVGAAFMLVFGQSATAILHCFILDEELNKTKGRDPVHTPEPLREFLEKVPQKSS